MLLGGKLSLFGAPRSNYDRPRLDERLEKAAAMTKEREVLIVTGGSRGIGAAVVRGAIKRGYRVCIGYVRHRAAAEELAAELGGLDGGVITVEGDVANPAFAERCFDRAEAALGPVTALVNNAGITGPIGRFTETSHQTLRRTTDVNLLGTLYMAQEAVRRWERAAVPGRIVNVSSVAAALGAPNEYVHYAATKAAVEAFTIGLAKEVAGSGMRVNAVAPGTAYTDIHAAAGEPDRPARIASRVPIGRIAEPEEIANAVLWLLSAEASYVTGTVLRVAGGL